MPLAIICMTLIFICLIGYWKSESLLMVTVFAAIVGCLIYVPQFLASVQTMEIVPSFAVGSAVGLRGFMSYIFGASLGTSLFGVMVDKMGWHGGFYLLMGGIVCCILFCYLSHRGALELEQQRKITEQEEARLALADAQLAPEPGGTKSQLAGSFAVDRGIDVRGGFRQRYKASIPAITDVAAEWPTSPG